MSGPGRAAANGSPPERSEDLPVLSQDYELAGKVGAGVGYGGETWVDPLKPCRGWRFQLDHRSRGDREGSRGSPSSSAAAVAPSERLRAGEGGNGPS